MRVNTDTPIFLSWHNLTNQKILYPPLNNLISYKILKIFFSSVNKLPHQTTPEMEDEIYHWGMRAYPWCPSGIYYIEKFGKFVALEGFALQVNLQILNLSYILHYWLEIYHAFQFILYETTHVLAYVFVCFCTCCCNCCCLNHISLKNMSNTINWYNVNYLFISSIYY